MSRLQSGGVLPCSCSNCQLAPELSFSSSPFINCSSNFNQWIILQEIHSAASDFAGVSWSTFCALSSSNLLQGTSPPTASVLALQTIIYHLWPSKLMRWSSESRVKIISRDMEEAFFMIVESVTSQMISGAPATCRWECQSGHCNIPTDSMGMCLHAISWDGEQYVFVQCCSLESHYVLHCYHQPKHRVSLLTGCSNVAGNTTEKMLTVQCKARMCIMPDRTWNKTRDSSKMHI